MKTHQWGNHKLFIHLAGLLALVCVHLLADYHHLQQRSGFSRYSPYLFLILMYGWIIFHNLVLFDGLFLKGKKRAYFSWTALALGISSLNMYFILHYGFQKSHPMMQILNFWIYTILGLGIYMIYRYLKDFEHKPLSIPSSTVSDGRVTHFTFTINNEKHQVPLNTILYLESLENYIKVHSLQKTYLVRLPLKEAEELLPQPHFIRISRSQIINTEYIQGIKQESLKIREQEFKIGKVYKKYVEEQLALLKVSDS